MKKSIILATMDVLRDFGFEPNRGPDYGFDESLVFDFGNFKLDADLGLNRHFRKVVFFSGNWSTGREMGLIEFELPCKVESRELCAALIAYRIGDAPAEAGWLSEGRQNQDLLPWKIELAAYNARPHCTVQRDWLRLALRTLASQLASMGDEAPVLLDFKDRVLSILCAGKVIALPGEGASWTHQVMIPAGNLRHLPKRLLNKEVSVAVWESRLSIDRCSFAGVVEVADPSGAQENQ